MELVYELTQKDFTQSFTAHRNRRPIVKWVRRIIVWGMLFASLFVLFGAVRTGNAGTLMPLFACVALWLIVIAGIPTRWSARRQFVKQPGAHGPRTVVMDESGVHWRWNGGSSDVEWKNYIRSVEGKNQFLLYTSPACFNIIPKGTLGKETISEVRNMLKEKIPLGK